MLAFLERMGRKFLGASMASGALLFAFLFVALTNKGLAAFPEFCNTIVMVYVAFGGTNAATAWATAKGTKQVDKTKTPPKPAKAE